MSLLDEAQKMVPSVSASESIKLIDEGHAIAIDVRNLGEINQTGMVKGALHLPFEQIATIKEESIPKTKILLLYCASGVRSAIAGKILLDQGYTDVRNLGSIKEWIISGGPLESI